MRAPGALEVRDLAAGYDSTLVISEVTFRVEPGQVAGLVGPNGGGKSTLLKAIAGVVPLRSGHVTLGAADLRDRASHVAFVPQREEVKWDFPVTALDVVLMGRARAVGWLRRPGREDRALASAALERFGLGGLGGRHISQFSGGQQQRIFFARVSAQQPFVVLLDEVFTGVDATNRAIFRDAIRNFADAGAIVVLVTHDFDELRAVCDTVGFVDRGLVTYGPLATTFTPENLRRAYGGQVAVIS
jgi:manganese/zinc/iron transport system ATP- binding protein